MSTQPTVLPNNWLKLTARGTHLSSEADQAQNGIVV